MEAACFKLFFSFFRFILQLLVQLLLLSLGVLKLQFEPFLLLGQLMNVRLKFCDLLVKLWLARLQAVSLLSELVSFSFDLVYLLLCLLLQLLDRLQCLLVLLKLSLLVLDDCV